MRAGGDCQPRDGGGRQAQTPGRHPHPQVRARQKVGRGKYRYMMKRKTKWQLFSCFSMIFKTVIAPLEWKFEL